MRTGEAFLTSVSNSYYETDNLFAERAIRRRPPFVSLGRAFDFAVEEATNRAYLLATSS